MSSQRLGVGFIGSRFNTKFHLQAFVGVRDGDVLGIWSPNADNAASAAQLARTLGVGDAQPHASIEDMVANPAIDALWLCGPNHARIENVEEIVDADFGRLGLGLRHRLSAPACGSGRRFGRCGRGSRRRTR